MLTPIFNPKDQEALYIQLKNAIVDEIISGRMASASKLPSVRKFSEHLNISRTTIENAYNQLLAEGYIYSEQGRGYYVEAIEAYSARSQAKGKEMLSVPSKPVYAYDFASEYVAEDAFDFHLWKKHINHILNYDQSSLYAYGALRGELQLREAICKQFYRSRGVIARPDQLVVGSGVTPLIAMLTRLLEAKGIGEIALEEPGFSKAMKVFKSNGMAIESLPVTFKGSELALLEESSVRACYVSPSHHFPTGQIMPVSDRQRLLRWADQVDGYIIEDDYNFELRYEGQPIPAMQGMDRAGRVIYIGSFSTVLAPAIRLSFVVLPDGLNGLFDQIDGMYPQTASKLEQLAMAHMIDTGDFDRHMRRVRKYYSKKRQMAMACLKESLPDIYRMRKVRAGLQIIISLPKGVTEDRLVEECRHKSVAVTGLSRYCFSNRKDWTPSIVVGIRGISDKDMVEGLRRLSSAAEAVFHKL